ncbi:MAG: amidohydrolase family protein [Christensenella sp.]|nr:amidohydrolase family protein [Christensenella sp.]
MDAFACHGDILYAPSSEKIEAYADHWIVVENGIVSGIFSTLPERYTGIERRDYGDCLIIPAFSDLHIHASQYFQRGVGMDKLLFDWLNDYTFPQEARFSDLPYAKAAYGALTDDFLRHGTFHASIFTTIHRDATDVLFDLLEKNGLSAFVGKVNMDQNSPDFLCETTRESLDETERFLADHRGGRSVQPILTPRFAPTCSEELLKGLGKLAKRYHIPMQTHLVESREQVAYTLSLFPGYASDAEIYQRAGLMENLSILAHVIFPSEHDLAILKATNSICVHCPDATANITAGIMPLVWLAEQGITIALGSDVGGGHGIPVYRQIARAIQLSKIKQFYELEQKRVTLARAFYHATKVGGSAFGNVGSLEEGYRFDALVLNGLNDEGYTLTPMERLERFCYIGDDRNISLRYINGEKLV